MEWGTRVSALPEKAVDADGNGQPQKGVQKPIPPGTAPMMIAELIKHLLFSCKPMAARQSHHKPASLKQAYNPAGATFLELIKVWTCSSALGRAKAHQ